MTLFDILIKDVPDGSLAPLLTEIANAGFTRPVVMPASPETGTPSAAAPPAMTDLPDDWRMVAEREAVSYGWPEEVDDYDRYRIFAGTTSGGTVHVAVGETFSQRWGQERRRAVAFLTSGAPQQPLCEFTGADDYDSTRDLLSVIRGRHGTGQMYGPGDPLPDVYRERFKTALYSERVRYPGAYNKQVAVVHEDDFVTMLNHALIQGRRRDAARGRPGRTIKGVTSPDFDGVNIQTLRFWELYWTNPTRHEGDPAITAERPVEKHLDMIRAELRARGK